MSFSTVRGAAVVVREDNPGDQRLVAYVECAHPGEHSASVDKNYSGRLMTSVRRHLEERLPRYMIPSTIVVVPSLPLTASGKVDRGALRQPDDSGPRRGAHVPPVSPIEHVVADTCAAILHLDRVGRHDNFFSDLGGHSLLAAQLVTHLRELCQIELPLRQLFETPTVAGLCDWILSDSARARKVGTIAELVLRVCALSDEQVESMSKIAGPVQGEAQ